jgi:hypothetical protein
MARTHIIGMLLGTEEDWPGAFEALMRRVDPIEHGGERHQFVTDRITIEPFDLRAVPRYALVIDRLSHWYYAPREWLKKVALMDDVYLLNNPFTFQAMEKHAAYCAMIRLGLHVPATWLLPHKKPPSNERFPYTAARYNRPFDLEEVADRIGYPMFMKPYDGGAWVGVSRVDDPLQLHRNYDESGQRLMHLQAAVEGYDEFVRSLSIGAETMVMSYDPGRPLHDRYQVRHDFLSAELGWEVVSIARLVNAFFGWEFNSCEALVKDATTHPIDYANACPDMALISLHYYFPWAITALAKWSVFCTVTGRRMQVDAHTRRYFDLGDREDLSYREKLEGYRRLADAHFDVQRYRDFCAEHLADLDARMLDYVDGPEFDALLVGTVRRAFPAHEHEQFVAHYRGLLAAWVHDQQAAVA